MDKAHHNTRASTRHYGVARVCPAAAPDIELNLKRTGDNLLTVWYVLRDRGEGIMDVKEHRKREKNFKTFLSLPKKIQDANEKAGQHGTRR